MIYSTHKSETWYTLNYCSTQGQSKLWHLILTFCSFSLISKSGIYIIHFLMHHQPQSITKVVKDCFSHAWKAWTPVCQRDSHEHSCEELPHCNSLYVKKSACQKDHEKAGYHFPLPFWRAHFGPPASASSSPKKVTFKDLWWSMKMLVQCHSWYVYSKQLHGLLYPYP